MKKLMFIIMFLTLLPTTVFAHTGLESSNPKDKEIITDPITEIRLTFNTNLEKLSTFELYDKQGQKLNVDSIKVERDILKGTFNGPLPNGDYTVNWKIAGEDGHIIERSFTFTVKMPEKTSQEPQTTPLIELTSSPTTTATPTLIPTPIESKQQVETTIPEKTPSNNRSTYIGVGIVVLFIIGSVGFIVRRRK